MDKKVLDFGKRVAGVSSRMSKHFEGDFAKFFNSPDPRINGKTPFELIWEDCDGGVKKVLGLLEAMNYGDFV